MAELKLDEVLADLEFCLKEEIDAIARRDWTTLEKTGPLKTDLAQEIEKLISDSDELNSANRERVESAGALIEENARLLRRMIEATGQVIEEVRRIRDRHGLSGLYGPEGKRRDSGATKADGVDHSI